MEYAKGCVNNMRLETECFETAVALAEQHFLYSCSAPALLYHNEPFLTIDISP